MRYLTAEELKNSHKDEAHTILENCDGQIVRFHSGISIFQNWHNKLLNGNKEAKILDLGTGSGGFAKQLKEIGCTNLYGTDIDDYRQADVKSLYREFKPADLSSDRLPWPDNTFDIVTAWCVLPHLENPFYCVREINRVLKKGGLFLFAVPHLTSKSSIDYFRKHKNFGHYRPTNNHLILFTDAIIQKAVLKYFKLVDDEYAVRPKIFEKGVKGKIRAVAYSLINKFFPEKGKTIRHRWAYDAIYTTQK